MIEFTPVDLGETEDVLIHCPECGGKAVIGSRASLSRDVSDLYCSCKDPQCGASFKYKLSFDKMLSPSARQSRDMMLDYLRKMPSAEQKELFSQLQA